MALSPLGLLALLAALPAPPSPEQVETFRTSVIGTTVLLAPATASEDDMLDVCIGSTGPPQVIDRIRAFPDGSVLRLHVEEVPYPEFRPLHIVGDTGFDYTAEVRGQRVARWCPGERFFWITAVDAPR